MSYPSKTIAVLRARHYKTIENSIGHLNILYYPISVTKNLYHDNVAAEQAKVIKTVGWIETDPPLKVVKQLGWWREGDTLPFLLHLPWKDGMIPKKDDEFEVQAEDQVMAGRYVINQVKQFGFMSAITWLCNINKKRQGL